MIVTTKLPDNLQLIRWPAAHVLAFTTNRLSAKKPILSSTQLPLIKNVDDGETFQSQFDYFNLGDHVGDSLNTVIHNRNSLIAHLPALTKIQWLNQVHGNDVVIVDEHKDSPIVADAVITRNHHIALAIMTADCLPILLSNEDGNEIAAIHAGWRPLAANIISNTLAKMRADNKRIYAWLGPCISQTHFEVGSEVKNAFCSISSELSRFFIVNSANKFQADLAGLASYFLKKAGVAYITHDQACTFAESAKYYSYRRENHTGRMASVICLKP